MSDTMTQRAANPSSREGDRLGVLELGCVVFPKAAVRPTLSNGNR